MENEKREGGGKMCFYSYAMWRVWIEKSVFINLSVPVVKYITRCGVCKICNAYVNTN